MIFLGDNVLLERDLTSDDIKPRLLGPFHPLRVSDTKAVTKHFEQVIGERAPA